MTSRNTSPSTTIIVRRRKQSMRLLLVVSALVVTVSSSSTSVTLAFRDAPKTPETAFQYHSSSSSSSIHNQQNKRLSFFRPKSSTSTKSPTSLPATAACASADSTEEAGVTDVSDSSIDKDNGTKKQPKEEQTTSLTFRGEVSFDSKELPLHPEKPEMFLSRFFKTPESRNLLVTGGGERPCTELELTPELFDDWTTKCEALGASPPTQDDSVISITTPGLSFPGLKVRNTAMVGSKFVDTAKPPRHEFVLLSNESEASGLPPVVWLYNKLTGHSKGGSTAAAMEGDGITPNKSSTNISSLSTVTYQKKNDRVVFTTNASLSIGMKFPKLLMKALGDKSKAEQVGAKSIRKTLDKDVVQSMTAFEKAYLSFLDEV
eukprot:CAMPEP_0113486522 /NCGR_PEP_ID=MMETSP0014_2-20120614/25040_1 /TAXON_ID=2857 /ORGANISM="Nitzschia sp." /LENGTH=374 /DNA_ID=CAMNT_0000380197 /DNA_START=264 /DNA_END=1388 /DNA_ORIENTATION=- /assembly_acc=CAM_ASM_000159